MLQRVALGTREYLRARPLERPVTAIPLGEHRGRLERVELGECQPLVRGQVDLAGENVDELLPRGQAGVDGHPSAEEQGHATCEELV